eukprot:jgi/Hompol1/5740/HPOL_004664-RA
MSGEGDLEGRASLEHISPGVVKRIARELAEVRTSPPEGIQLIPNDENILDIQAWIQGPTETPYESGCFRVQLVLSSDFPQSPPKGYFRTTIYHPNVAENGEICVSTLKKDWQSDHGIRHILLVIKCLLIVPNPESALNEEAGRLLLEDYESFASHAKMMTSIHAQNSNIRFTQQSKASSSSTDKGLADIKTAGSEVECVPAAAENDAKQNIDIVDADSCGGMHTQSKSSDSAAKRKRVPATAAVAAEAAKRAVADKRRTLRRL